MKSLLIDKGDYPITALLIKKSAMHHASIHEHYGQFLQYSALAYSLPYEKGNTVSVKFAREYLEYLLPEFRKEAITTIFVADASYFKALTRLSKTSVCFGDIFPCTMPGYTDFKVILSVNYKALFHNPAMQDRLTLSISTLNAHLTGNYSKLGTNIIHEAYYPADIDAIKKVLKVLLQYPILSCDIETFSLKLGEAGVGTIGFAIDRHNGIAFAVDISPETKIPVRAALKEFFQNYTGKLIFHKGNFDIRNIIFNIFMTHPLDYVGMLHGLHTMFRDVDDTLLIAYLATNSTTGNTLSLKHLAHAFAGNYAQEDIHDITLIPLPELLEYNLIDCLATWYVHDLYYPKMVQDQQEDIYKTLFLPSLKNVTHMELVGMPMVMGTVDELDVYLSNVKQSYQTVLEQSNVLKEFSWKEKVNVYVERNAALKKKVVSLDDVDYTFNSSSSTQVGKLLHTHLGFEVIDTTDKGAPAVGKKSLMKLFNKLIRQYDIDETTL